MNSLFDLLPLNIWEDISFYCFNEFRVLNKESYNISMIHYRNIMKSIDIKQKIWNENEFSDIQLLMIKNLINYGIYDIDECMDNYDYTFLIHSCEKNDIKSVEYLLENNANIYKCDSYKYIPLHRACSHDNNNNIDIIKCLINKSIDNYNNGNSEISVKEYINKKNVYGDSSLQKVLKFNNNIDIVKLLLENGADINIKNNFGSTPLDFANDEIKEYLRK